MNGRLNKILEHHRRERDAALAQAVVPRDLTPILQKGLSSSLIKVITGPRRAGKSTLAFQALAGRKFAYVNFEDDAFRGSIASDELVASLQDVYEEPDFFFFDEIQNHPMWESFINKLHRRGFNLVITGSNSRLLSRELGSALTGRHLAFELLPFSYKEFISATLSEERRGEAEMMKAFSEYLLWGGFPEVVLERADRLGYLASLFDSVVLRDIVARRRVRQSTAMYDLLTLMMNSAASRFTGRSLERSLGVLSIATIQKYLAYSREAYLIQDLQPYCFKPRVRIKADRKVYAFDNGFITARSQPAISNEPRLLENLVFVELVRRGFRPNLGLFYYQTRSGSEIDFLIRQGARNVELLQVTKTMASLKTREREVNALVLAAGELHVKKLTIITMDAEEKIRQSGHEIRVVPCWKWLQSPEGPLYV